jgi:hypothetical protein
MVMVILSLSGEGTFLAPPLVRQEALLQVSAVEFRCDCKSHGDLAKLQTRAQWGWSRPEILHFSQVLAGSWPALGEVIQRGTDSRVLS